MVTGDAVQLLSRFASLQGRLVRKFLELYEPKDRERFRDVPNGTLSIEGATWTHRRHGAGVAFTGINNVRVNAHVGMNEYPEGIDGGRFFEYLESIGISVVDFAGIEYNVTMCDMDKMVDELWRRGILRAVTTEGRFAHRLFVLCC
ncbi:hypothetical protein WME79_46450 [Sorangium sp. So ce726]|uniref:DUF6896 domain-containing protein n=1 Tax=Sorangium sp. So ce726 TaxID=3133319 RepID=UPI003F618E2A